MKSFISIIGLVAAINFCFAFGNVAQPRNSTLKSALQPRNVLDCVAMSNTIYPINWFVDHDCTQVPGYLTIPDYWSLLAQQIPDDREYSNYEKMICSPLAAYKVCAFVDGMKDDDKIPGFQVKALFRHMAHWCDKSRCGECNVANVDGPVRQGRFKINSVNNMGKCLERC